MILSRGKFAVVAVLTSASKFQPTMVSASRVGTSTLANAEAGTSEIAIKAASSKAEMRLILFISFLLLIIVAAVKAHFYGYILT